jgi:hypothetical protein
MTDLHALALALEALCRTEPLDRADLPSWYERAHSLGETIRADAGLCGAVPEHVWHYLSDADIRLKDKDYAKVQREGMIEIIAELKSGRLA